MTSELKKKIKAMLKMEDGYKTFLLMTMISSFIYVANINYNLRRKLEKQEKEMNEKLTNEQEKI